MLVINYNGNKPTTDYFKFSVQGNNNADVVRFCLEKKQGKIDLSGYKVYVQAYCEEDNFIDKVEITDNVNIVDNQLSADWTLLKKHTVNRQLLVSLSFEDLDNEVVWQTQIIKITIANGIDADEEMINKYPTVIEEMQKEIARPKEKNSFIQSDYGNGVYFEEDCRVLLTENVMQRSKLIRARYLGKTKGNKLTDITINKGYHSIQEILEMLFGYEGTIGFYNVGQVNSQIEQAYSNWKINVRSNKNKTFCSFNKNTILANTISSKIKNYARYTSNKNIAVIKLQFKFVKDLKIVETEKTYYWKGTMSNAYLECVVFVFSRLPNAYITAQVKSF